ncbi:alpha/beta hydrolase [Bacteriovoracaceae bacterium]|nr:alpha/beta hydrolase [Bacteriovoracaceae bacterium]
MIETNIVNGLEVHNIKGEGAPIVFLHGGPGVYGYIEKLCHLLSVNSNIFYYNQRGSRQNSNHIKIEDHVFDLEKIIDYVSTEAKPILVGHSWGAMLGVLFAGRYSEKIQKLILVGTGPLNGKQEREFFKNLDERFGDQKEYYDGLWDIVEKETDSQKKQEFANDYINKVSHFYQHNKGSVAELLPMFYDFEALYETMVDMDKLKSIGEYENMLSQINVHVTCMHGDYDPVPSKSIFGLVRKYHPSAEIFEFKNCGHYPWVETCKEEFLFILRKQLK